MLREWPRSFLPWLAFPANSNFPDGLVHACPSIMAHLASCCRQEAAWGDGERQPGKCLKPACGTGTSESDTEQPTESEHHTGDVSARAVTPLSMWRALVGSLGQVLCSSHPKPSKKMCICDVGCAQGLSFSSSSGAVVVFPVPSEPGTLCWGGGICCLALAVTHSEPGRALGRDLSTAHQLPLLPAWLQQRPAACHGCFPAPGKCWVLLSTAVTAPFLCWFQARTKLLHPAAFS